MNGVELGVWIINKTLTEILEPKFDSPSARLQLLTMGLQESRFMDRVQNRNGPAHSFWQEEPNGIKAVFNHKIVGPILVDVCNKLGVAPNWLHVYTAVILNDELACTVARLLLYADLNPLPKVGDCDGAFKCYIRVWGPGAYKHGKNTARAKLRAKWDKNYKIAMGYVNE